MKKRIVFFSDHEWSLGRANTTIIKHLWQYGIDAQLMSWQKPLPTNLEISQMIKATDYFISSAMGCQYLYEVYKVPLEKIVFGIYHTVDIDHLVNWGNQAKQCKIFTVDEMYVPTIRSLGYNVELVTLLIDTDAFYLEPSISLNVLGYAGSYNSRQSTEEGIKNGSRDPWVYKRGYLASEIAEQVNMPIRIATQMNTTFRSMPGWYSTVDAVICASIDQGAGFPVLEAGAAGRLVMSVNEGNYSKVVTELGADCLPTEESQFKQEACRLIEYYKANPYKYRERCYAIREYALKHYDIGSYIYQWVDLFSN